MRKGDTENRCREAMKFVGQIAEWEGTHGMEMITHFTVHLCSSLSPSMVY